MAFVSAAVLGAGLLGAGASIYGANKAAGIQSDAARKAAEIQAKGQADALGFQREVFDTQKANYLDAKANFGDTKNYLTPFINNGVTASNTLAGGLNGNPSALEAFYNSPDFKFALRGGSEALDNSAAARGGLLSGNQIRAQTEFGTGLATQSLQNYFARLSGMAGQGIQAGGLLGQFGAHLGQTGASLGNGVVGPNATTNLTGSNNVAQSIMGAGTADASGVLGTVKGINSGLSALTTFAGSQSSFKGSPTNYLASYNGNQIGGLY